MKFEIDTATKTITLVGELKLSDIDKIKKFIGEDWKNWTVKGTTTYVNSPTWYPYVPHIPYVQPLINPYSPPYIPTWISQGATVSYYGTGSSASNNINMMNGNPTCTTGNGGVLSGNFGTSIANSDTIASNVMPTRFMVEVGDDKKEFGFCLSDLNVADYVEN